MDTDKDTTIGVETGMSTFDTHFNNCLWHLTTTYLITNNAGHAKQKLEVSTGFHDDSGHTAAIINCAGRISCLHDTSKKKEIKKLL